MKLTFVRNVLRDFLHSSMLKPDVPPTKACVHFGNVCPMQSVPTLLHRCRVDEIIHYTGTFRHRNAIADELDKHGYLRKCTEVSVCF